MKVLLCGAVLSLCGGLSASVVELLNGDQISGEIVGKDDKFVHVKTEFLGVLDIPADKVAGIRELEEKPVVPPAVASTPPPPSAAAAPTSPAGVASAPPPPAAPAPAASATVPPPGGPVVAPGPDSRYFGFLLPMSLYRRLAELRSWDTNIKLSLNMTQSSTDYYNHAVAVTSERKWDDKYEAKLGFSQNYATTTDDDGTKTESANKMKMSGRFRHNYGASLFFQSESQAGYARVSGIDRDFIQSFGLGWKAAKSERLTVDLVPSLSIEKQKVDGVYEELTPSPTFSEEMSIKFSDGFSIRNEASAMFPIDSENDPSWRLLVALENQLLRNLFTSLEYEIEYDGAVSTSSEALSNNIKASIGIKL